MFLTADLTEINEIDQLGEYKMLGSLNNHSEMYLNNLTFLTSDIAKHKIKEVKEAIFYWRRLKKTALKILSFIEYGTGVKSSIEFLKAYITNFFSKPTSEKDSEKKKNFTYNIFGLSESKTGLVSDITNEPQWGEEGEEISKFGNVFNLNEDFWGEKSNSLYNLLDTINREYSKNRFNDDFDVSTFREKCLELVRLYPTPFIDRGYKSKIIDYAEKSNVDQGYYGPNAFSNFNIIIDTSITYNDEKHDLMRKIEELSSKLAIVSNKQDVNNEIIKKQVEKSAVDTSKVYVDQIFKNLNGYGDYKKWREVRCAEISIYFEKLYNLQDKTASLFFQKSNDDSLSSTFMGVAPYITSTGNDCKKKKFNTNSFTNCNDTDRINLLCALVRSLKNNVPDHILPIIKLLDDYNSNPTSLNLVDDIVKQIDGIFKLLFKEKDVRNENISLSFKESFADGSSTLATTIVEKLVVKKTPGLQQSMTAYLWIVRCLAFPIESPFDCRNYELHESEEKIWVKEVYKDLAHNEIDDIEMGGTNAQSTNVSQEVAKENKKSK